jgi:hypothetical protein
MSTHCITQLAALITTNVTGEGCLEDGYLIILVWRDCGMRIKFPSGGTMDVGSSNRDLDATIKVALGLIHDCCLEVGREAQITVHRVPAALTSAEQIFSWLQSLPGVVLDIPRPEGMGFGGPTPPAGQAG